MSTSSKGLADFIAEATEILEQLGRDLLQLDNHRGQEADPELVNAIFRGAHSLKGLSGMFGQDGIAKLAHTAEDLLDRLRLGKVSLTDEVLDALIESLDAFQGLLAEASRDESVPAISERADRLAVRLEALSSGKPTQGTQDPLDQIELDAAIRAVFTEYEEHRLRENVR
ncbi:MAG TPA: Hpt domain-containing protein, partial [Myxococcaceae bacterium]|nr:Hpt domain-containing protein [Myxococcaceae bacterium]